MWRKAESWFVYLVTAGLLIAAIAANFIWTKNIGIQEDWLMIGPWLGKDSDILGWLWSLNNGHRTPLPRLIYLSLLWLTDEFRAGALLSQLLLAGLALILAHTAAKARGGGLRIYDAVYPLALLHLGHWNNIEWGWQIQFVSTTVLAGLLLCAVALRPLPSRAAGWLAFFSAILLPLTGLPGIVLAVGMIPWFLATIFAATGEARSTRVVLVAAVVIILAYTVAYFIGWAPGWAPERPDINRLIEATIEYFALAKGWPFMHALDRAVGVLVLALCVYAIVLCARAWFADRRDARAFGLANFIGVNMALGATIAYSRGTYYSDFLNMSYAIFAVLPLFASLMTVQIYGRPIFGRPLLPYAVAAGFVVIMPMNIDGGFAWRDWYLGGVANYEADVAAGLSVSDIAQRNTGFLLHSCDGCLLPLLRDLRDAGIEPYNRLPPD
jgi:hypothetical protein